MNALRGALVLVLVVLCVRAAGSATWPGVAVLMYHRVDARVPADAVGRDLTVEPGPFAAQLAYLRGRHIAAITAQELARDLMRGVRPSHAVVLTFDDGYDDAATVALPILVAHGARATFFVSSALIGTPRHLSWKQVRQLRAAGMEVACHGSFHLDLSTLDRAGQEREAVGCVHRFARYVGGSAPITYAYPAGKYNDTTFAVMREIGVRAAFTERAGAVTDLSRPFELPRRRVRHDDGVARFADLVDP